jgi:hypothetical protein
LEAPEFLDAGWVRHAYWRLVLPADEHVVSSPSGLTSEQVWRRGRWFWERQPALTQRDLERWSGASQQPEAGARRDYLYSTFGVVKNLEVYTVHRSAAVLGLSGFVLVCGLFVIRTAPARRLRWAPQAAALAAALLVAVVAWAPELAVLAAQGAALGVAAVVLVWAVTRWSARRRKSLPVGGALPSSRRGSATRVSPRSGMRSSYATTATAPPPGALE